MTTAPDPQQIYERAKTEGRRRLDMATLEKVTTGFIAGVTIVFGIAALGIVSADVAASLGEGIGKVAGAFAFGIGVVFLVVGRAELFTEDFFDPVAVAIDQGGATVWKLLLRLWVVTLALNLLGGALLVAVLVVPGALPPGAAEALVTVAEEITAKSAAATLARAVLAGALIALLSYMLKATNTVAARILVAFLVGFVLALGPFDHVVVSALHLLLGIWLGGEVGYADLAVNIGLATVGNLVGGLGLITFTHTAQARSTDG